MIVSIVGGFIFRDGVNYLQYIWTLAVLIPDIALDVRRLHDIGKSGWSLLVFLIPFVGWIILLVWFCQPSKD